MVTMKWLCVIVGMIVPACGLSSNPIAPSRPQGPITGTIPTIGFSSVSDSSLTVVNDSEESCGNTQEDTTEDS